jgi:hypothetical protein
MERQGKGKEWVIKSLSNPPLAKEGIINFH